MSINGPASNALAEPNVMKQTESIKNLIQGG